MNFRITAGLMVLAAGGVTLGLLGGDGKGGDVGPVEPVKVEELRPVVLAGLCPASVTAEAAKCKEVVQMEGRCLCLSAQAVGQVDGEVNDASALPAAERVRLLVCGDKPGKTTVRHLKGAEPFDDKICSVVTSASNPTGEISINVSMGSYETDMPALLREACAPCAVGPSTSGECPHCLRYVGGCASVCGAEHVEP